MPQGSEAVPSILYWMNCLVLLLWGLGGAAIYVAYFVETPEEFAAMAETAANRQAYADYVANMPLWVIPVGVAIWFAHASRAKGIINQAVCGSCAL